MGMRDFCFYFSMHKLNLALFSLCQVTVADKYHFIVVFPEAAGDIMDGRR